MGKGACTHWKGHGEVGSRSWIKNIRRSLNFSEKNIEEELRSCEVKVSKASVGWQNGKVAEVALAHTRTNLARQKDKRKQLDEKGLVVLDKHAERYQLGLQGRIWNDELRREEKDKEDEKGHWVTVATARTEEAASAGSQAAGSQDAVPVRLSPRRARARSRSSSSSSNTMWSRLALRMGDTRVTTSGSSVQTRRPRSRSRPRDQKGGQEDDIDTVHYLKQRQLASSRCRQGCTSRSGSSSSNHFSCYKRCRDSSSQARTQQALQRPIQGCSSKASKAPRKNASTRAQQKYKAATSSGKCLGESQRRWAHRPQSAVRCAGGVSWGADVVLSLVKAGSPMPQEQAIFEAAEKTCDVKEYRHFSVDPIRRGGPTAEQCKQLAKMVLFAQGKVMKGKRVAVQSGQG